MGGVTSAYTRTVIGERKPHEGSERGSWVSSRVGRSGRNQSVPRREILGRRRVHA